MTEDLENDKWINIHIGVTSVAFGIIKVKKELEEYSKELGWEIKVNKKGYVDDNGDRRFNITLAPKNGNISPEELREQIDFIGGLASSIFIEIINLGDRKNLLGIPVQFGCYKNKENKDILNVTIGVLIIECELKKAIKLELENPNLFKKAFDISLVNWYHNNLDDKDSLMMSSEGKKEAIKTIKALEDNGMPKENIKKKNIFKRILSKKRSIIIK